MQEIEQSGGPVKRYARPQDAIDATGAAAVPKPDAPMELPPWLRATMAPEGTIEGLLRPSDAADDEGARIRTGESIAIRARALRRGVLAHRLLQSLPDIATDRRHNAALRYLAHNADGWSGDDREKLAASVLGLIADPRFGEVFAAGSRAEVSIVGRLDRPGRPPALVSGQIDRLVITAGEILIVDYKTNHAPPAAAAQAPAAYVRQLALYRAVLSKLYPQRSVRAALLWTETPELMEIPAPALDAELASALSRDDHA
jgi:ATP-dependent helicase/nuclease subunit A